MRLLGFILAGVLALSGCSPYVQRGETLYHEGRYIEAAEVFELTEQRLAESKPEVRAQYGLYRGLTFLRLDDLASARQWLGYAFAIEQKSPGTLGTPFRGMLEKGWSELEQRAVAQPELSADTEERVAATENGVQRRPAVGNGRRSVAAGQAQ